MHHPLKCHKQTDFGCTFNYSTSLRTISVNA